MKHLFFVGITGHTMRGLAEACTQLGYKVSGFDPAGADPGAAWLDEHGIPWSREFQIADLHGVEAVIVTGAHVSPDTPVIIEAAKHDISVKSWAQLVGELSAKAHVIAVAGTHGKTTTSSLITWLLESAGRHPDYVIGIQPFNFDSSVRLSGAKTMVVEGDEYRASPLEDKSKLQYYHPDTLIVTNIEMDHPDFFANEAAVMSRFEEIIAALPKSGRLIVCAENSNALAAARVAPCNIITYGLHTGDYQARNIAYVPAGIEFDVVAYGNVLGRVALPVFGRHNVLNSLSAIAAVLKAGLDLGQVINGATEFKGSYRRFNRLTTSDDAVTVIDDYAHHPTEVAATLEAARLHYRHRRIIAVFRPHTYSRTAALLANYANAFNEADMSIITGIEGAREAHLSHTVSGADVAKVAGKTATYLENRPEVVTHLKAHIQPGDVLVCMTVSGFDNLANELATSLNAK
jgi:UDP-N-acetylmuramate--alanine ligase